MDENTQPLWSALTREEQEEFRNLHSEPGEADSEARLIELTTLAHERLAKEPDISGRY